MLTRTSTVLVLIAASAFNCFAPTVFAAKADKPRGPIIVLPKCYREECSPTFVCNGFFCHIEWQCVTIEVPCPIISA
jgi:hypothetical protein